MPQDTTGKAAFDNRCRKSGLGLMLAAVALAVILALVPDRTNGLARYLFAHQDLGWLIGFGLALYVLPAVTARLSAAIGEDAAWQLSPRQLASIGVALAALVWLAAPLVTFGHPLARDEMMAEFDAQIFARGQLMAPVAETWRPFARALAPEFTLITHGATHWVSYYLPMNAAIRALADGVSAASLVNPALLLVALWATWSVAQRLWPDRPDAAVVSVVLLATSPQVIGTAMTPFAMTAHLALNAVWLLSFLRNDRIGHLLALAIGAVAVGLHQVVFHPLFVAPFMVMLLIDRRWLLAAYYAAGYGAICLAWVLYWQWAAAAEGATLAPVAAEGTQFLLMRLAALFTDRMPQGEISMMLNLARFFAWQHLLLLPLLVAALAQGAALRDRTLRCLFASAVLTFVAMLILLPYQGHGWGYRYLQSVLGGLVLVAAAGWVYLVPRSLGSDAAPVWQRFIVATLFGLVLSLPLHLAQMRSFIQPFATAVASIRATPADVVIVETDTFAFSYDVIQNDPYLARKPLILPLSNLPEFVPAEFCKRHRVALFTSTEAMAIGMLSAGPTPEASDAPPYRRLSVLKAAGCNGVVTPRLK